MAMTYPGAFHVSKLRIVWHCVRRRTDIIRPQANNDFSSVAHQALPRLNV